MADVMPFTALRYNTKAKGINLAQVIAPPYDVISPDLQRALHERDPYNFVRLDFGFTQPNDDDFNNRYTRASALLQQWKTEEILIPEKRRCYYVYEQEFTVPESGERLSRRGFFGAVRLQDYRTGRIRAHERTFDSPKTDRLKLMRATQANLSPVFVLFSDPEGQARAEIAAICATPPSEEITDENGVVHRLWIVSKKERILTLREALKQRNLFIADGHHRYETALNYRDEMREFTGHREGRQGFDYTLMYLNDFDDDGLVILPTHRVLAREYGEMDLELILEDLGEFFTLKEFTVDMSDLDKASAKVSQMVKLTKGVTTRLVMILPSGRAWTLTLKKAVDYDEMIEEKKIHTEVKKLDVTILHRYVISRGWIGNPEVELEEGDVFYEKSVKGALDLLRRRKGCVGFIMNPTTKKQVQAIAELGELLPQKSTFFYPKLASGLLVRDLTIELE